MVSRGTGFLGETLVRRLLQRGAEVLVLSRDPSKVRAGRGIPWSAVSEAGTADVIVNLAGENVGAGRWTAERKRNILNSRVEATTALVSAIRRAREKPRTFISASAVGFYGVRGDEILDERSENGAGFLADVTREWEEAARRVEGVARVVILRFGVVLAKDGGPLKKMLLPFYFGAGGPIGSGKQWMSWVDREDVLRAIDWAIDNPQVRGIYNITAPEPVRNRDFAQALGRSVHRPSFMPTPAFALRAMFGEMANEILLGGQRVVPSRATQEGFTFNYPTLDASLQHD